MLIYPSSKCWSVILCWYFDDSDIIYWTKRLKQIHLILHEAEGARKNLNSTNGNEIDLLDESNWDTKSNEWDKNH